MYAYFHKGELIDKKNLFTHLFIYKTRGYNSNVLEVSWHTVWSNFSTVTTAALYFYTHFCSANNCL